ncbi:hypothetical protein J421_0130 [Gemmatirosa kalamazoonensis]|uniref:Serine aminopeptidase S33 domain-containing protein n=1 Tax=Gemmatirosa kalamazoonensis TaxID=861299 RepID=W0RB29_9BACT|nr:alpha/beta fold hydrolase [Gemmatirosa kalamazoonensis]AHG87667.1 hypothetical protein J421_0130 [Gemmatirosa kalamazoonensis]
MRDRFRLTRVRRWAPWLALAPVALVGALAGAIAWRVSARVRATLHPPRAPIVAPDGLTDVRDVRFAAADGIELHGWYVPSRNGAAVILGHGWGADRGAMLPEARALAERGYGVLLFDWRGHGESGGTRTTWGVDEQRDFDAAIAFVTARPDVDSTRIGAIGFSMGGMVVAQVAERDPRVRAVAVEGAFTSLEDEMRHDEGKWKWWSGSVAVWTLRLAGVAVERERPIDGICRLSPRPLLVIDGSVDADLPVSVARHMYAQACAPKQLWIIPGATHRTYAASAGREFGARLGAFFDDGLRPRDGRGLTAARVP